MSSFLSLLHLSLVSAYNSFNDNFVVRDAVECGWKSNHLLLAKQEPSFEKKVLLKGNKYKTA